MFCIPKLPPEAARNCPESNSFACGINIMPLLHMSAILRNMVGYRFFHMKILTLRTNKNLISRAWDCVRAGMLGFFLALLTRSEIDFKIASATCVLGSLLNDSICLFEVILVSTIDHSRPLWSSLDQRRDFALFLGAAHAWIIPNTHML